MFAAAIHALVSMGALAGVYGALERCFPARRQPVLRPAWATDALFFFGQYLVWSLLSLQLLSFVGRALAGLPRVEQPVWLGAIEVVVAGDLLVYWFHRACHRFDFLWRFHAVHHSAEHLDWLAAHREHPVDGVCTHLLQNLPALLLGFPIEAIAAFAVFRGMWAIFIHSNVKVPLGPLRFVLGAPDLHHWHHARLRQTEHNFGNLAPWLDVVFGTYHRPVGDETYPLGLEGAYPRSYPGMLVEPFRPRAAATAPAEIG